MRSLPKAWVQSLVLELTAHKPHCMAKKKKKLVFHNDMNILNH